MPHIVHIAGSPGLVAAHHVGIDLEAAGCGELALVVHGEQVRSETALDEALEPAHHDRGIVAAIEDGAVVHSQQTFDQPRGGGTPPAAQGQWPLGIDHGDLVTQLPEAAIEGIALQNAPMAGAQTEYDQCDFHRDLSLFNIFW